MQTVSISNDGFLAMADREESHFFDIKDRDIQPEKLVRSVVAFANADGGTLIVGIADKKDEPKRQDSWRGFSDLEAMNGLLQAVYSCSPTIPVAVSAISCESRNGYLVRFEIDKSSDVCKTNADEVFVRRGAQSVKVKDPQKIQALAFAKGAATFEDDVVRGLPPEILVDARELSIFLSQQTLPIDGLDFLVNQNLVDYKSWEPRVGGLLLFHENPSSFVPRRCGVRITRYETREDDPEREHLASQVSIEGPLKYLIEKSVEVVTDIMSNVAVWTPSGMRKLSYPSEAVWETVANAIIHRDYSVSDDVQVLIYNDRIEIKSPGRLPGFVTVDNILDARYSRNPKIVRTLSRYADAPNKDMGEGLNTTFQKMKEFGLQEPRIQEEDNYFIVTLPHTPLASPAEAILSYLENNSLIRNSQVREITGIKSENAVKQEFYKLRDRGLIEPVPGMRGRNSAWQKTKN